MIERWTPPVLLIGIGNDLRGDDTAGWRIADRVAAWNRSGVTVMHARQLLPEMAAAMAEASTVVLVDATVGGDDAPSIRSASIDPVRTPVSHSASLAELLALAGCLKDSTPQAWTLAIPAEDFDFGADLSPRCQAGVEAGLRLLAERLPLE